MKNKATRADDLDPATVMSGQMEHATLVELLAHSARAGFDGSLSGEILADVAERLELLGAAVRAPPGTLSAATLEVVVHRLRAAVLVAAELSRRETAGHDGGEEKEAPASSAKPKASAA